MDLTSHLYARCGLILKWARFTDKPRRETRREVARDNPTNDRSHNRSDSVVNDPFRVLLHFLHEFTSRSLHHAIFYFRLCFLLLSHKRIFYFFSLYTSLRSVFVAIEIRFIALLLHASDSAKLQCSSVSTFLSPSYALAFLLTSEVSLCNSCLYDRDENVFLRISQKKKIFLFLKKCAISFRFRNKWIA